MRNNGKIIHRIVSVLAAAVITVFATSALIGCSLFDFLRAGDGYIEFVRGSLALRIGDVYDLDGIIDTDEARYTLSSSDRTVVSVSGTVVTAKSVGKAVITAKTSYSSDSINITVSDKEPDSFIVEPQGDLTQTIGAATVIRFIPTATGSVENNSVKWYVNGDLKQSLSSGEAFEFLPTEAGEYSVKAVCGTLEAAHTVRAYYPITATVTYDGNLSQHSEPYSAIIFTVTAENKIVNPSNYVTWYEDDNVIYSGIDLTYTYVPKPGRHTFAVEVNGVKRETFDLLCAGAITPLAPTIVFDNLYPHVYLDYEVEGTPCVEITLPQGSPVEYAADDVRYAALFDENGFDISEYVSLCADNTVRRSYRFRVKSLGDGALLNESDWSEYFTFVQLPNAAAKYIAMPCLDIDHYVTSDREYVELLEYYVNFRPKTSSTSRVSFSCYIGYDMDGDEEDLWNDAFEIAATSGSYTRIGVSLASNVMSTSFTVDTVNTPTRQSVTGASASRYDKQLHAVLPHINYDEEKYRPNSYVFPIDKLTKTTVVEYTDELYIAAQYNTRPVPRVGSTAETVYNMARDVLRKICTDDMTDVQKAHAIYDWIMWKVTYDTPATEVARGGESYSAYYLEGVFGDGTTPIGGVAYSPYAVCDGMSKAYSLMCNIEGIPCTRVVGEAGNSIATASGHAWNKVLVNGSWYSVDCTWGDSQGVMSLDGRQSYAYELGMHDHLFLTDAQMSPTHFEPYMTGETSIEYAPKTSKVKYNVYADMSYNGVAIDCYVRQNENSRERLREIATAYARSYVRRDTLVVPGGTNGGVYEIGYQGLDIYADGIDLNDSEISAVITSAVKTVDPTASVKVYTYDSIILLLVK